MVLLFCHRCSVYLLRILIYYCVVVVRGSLVDLFRTPNITILTTRIISNWGQRKMATFGTTNEASRGDTGTWLEYCERLDHYFLVNGIMDDNIWTIRNFDEWPSYFQTTTNYGSLHVDHISELRKLSEFWNFGDICHEL